jgi:hypothetical protein
MEPRYVIFPNEADEISERSRRNFYVKVRLHTPLEPGVDGLRLLLGAK